MAKFKSLEIAKTGAFIPMKSANLPKRGSCFGVSEPAHPTPASR